MQTVRSHQTQMHVAMLGRHSGRVIDGPHFDHEVAMRLDERSQPRRHPMQRESRHSNGGRNFREGSCKAGSSSRNFSSAIIGRTPHKTALTGPDPRSPQTGVRRQLPRSEALIYVYRSIKTDFYRASERRCQWRISLDFEDEFSLSFEERCRSIVMARSRMRWRSRLGARASLMRALSCPNTCLLGQIGSRRRQFVGW